ncbi:uncharacterized protein LOC143459784 [Clavelina lepadiformis]|uniref:Uncharacterized protein n=1 Tax=Clavelina lepadiformis TaxID=159417 RepID=A0ABP0GBP6_CLALP
MVGGPGQDNEHPTYGFGVSGMMSKELFPIFMGAYCIAVVLAIAITGWKLKDYNKKGKKIKYVIKDSDLDDSDATFVPETQPRRMKTRKELQERGRPRTRQLHSRQKKQLKALEANQQKDNSETDSSYEEEAL